MAYVSADRVRDTTATTGTGALSLSGSPPVGFRTFSAVCGIGDTVPYAVASPGGADWEVGVGTYSALNTLTRTTVLASSNAGAAVNFPAGAKEVLLSFVAAAPLRIPSLTVSAATDVLLGVMPGSDAGGTVTIGRHVGHADRNHQIFAYNSATPASNLLAFRVHNGTVGARTDVLTLRGDGAVLATGRITTASQLESTVATGTAPLAVASTTKVANLNADLLDDQSGAHYLDLANHTGNLAVARLNSGTGASASTYWRGDGTWAAAPAEADTLATVAGRGATTATALSLTNATASTSTTTGALRVTGGVGIAGDLWVDEIRAARLGLDANGYLTLNGANPVLNFDAADYLQYTRASNQMDLLIGGASRLTVNAAIAAFGVPLTLSGAPSTGLHAANKEYVDNGRFRVLAQEAATPVGSFIFSLPADCDSFEIVGKGLRPSVDDAVLYFRFSFDGGATYAVNNADYYTSGTQSLASGTGNVYEQTGFGRCSGSNGVNEPAGLRLLVLPAPAGARSVVLSDAMTANSTGVRTRWSGGTEMITAPARPTHILIGFTSANIQGRATLYGSKT